MAIFTIDTENNIAAHAAVPTNLENAQAFASEKELAKIAAEWPGSRLVEVWNSFAGVAPFTELKPAKKFTSRRAAVSRIWAAVQRLSAHGAEQASDVAHTKRKSKKSAAKSSRQARAREAAKGDENRSDKKAEVLAMMKRAKGATLAEIIEATGWQAHTVRGFVSILGSRVARRWSLPRTLPGSARTASPSSHVRLKFPRRLGSQPGRRCCLVRNPSCPRNI